MTPSASAWCYATPEDRAWWGGLWADRILHSDLAVQLRRSGAASERTLEGIAAGWLEWAAAPDGWISIPHGELICRA